ncbi:MAG TPA: hypothetical protein VFT02_12010 [Pyrinomonadaceae bacterium]|nr:hypothetical protein [Pyrinomonadaceae bacterium]
MRAQSMYLSRFLFTLPVLVSLLFMATPARAQQATYSTGTPALSGSESRHISSISSHATANGSRVVLTFSEALSDYGAYRNGNKYTVLLPGTDLALTEINVKGTGFTNSKLESRGANLALTFELEANVSASVNQIENRLEVSFSKATISGDPNAAAGTGVNNEAERTTEPERTGPALLTSSGASGGSTSPVSVASRAVNAPAPQNLRGTDSDNITQRQVDLSVPESPAFTVLGVTPETVTRPTTPREFATSFLNGVDQQGNFQTGLAMDFVPYLTFFGGQTSLSSYSKSRVERFLARTQVSFATTKGASDDDKSSRLALGLRLTLFDKGDPRLDTQLRDCYREKLKVNRDRLEEFDQPPNDEDDDVRALRLKNREGVLLEAVKPCNEVARKRNWNATGWIVGAAPSWISETGETADFHWNGAGVWTSFAYGFEEVKALKDNSQLILHARYRSNEIVPDTENEGEFLSQDSFFFGGRLRMSPGSAAKTIFSVEGNYIRSRLNKGLYDTSSRFSLGLERRIADNIWFTLALGGQGGRIDGQNKPFVLTSFKWGFDKQR